MSATRAAPTPAHSPAVAPLAPSERERGRRSAPLPGCERPALLPAGVQWREAIVNGQQLGYLLTRSRRRTIGFLIGDAGLRVTAPTWASQAQIDAAIGQKASWIFTKLHAWQDRHEQLRQAQSRWRDGGSMPYLGVAITLKLDPDGSRPAADPADYQGDADAPQPTDSLRLALPADAEPARVREYAERWLQRQAAALFARWLSTMAAQHGLQVSKLRLSAARTRWGSCTSDGRIMLNWRLIHFSPAMIRYVIAHELAHLREMNHGPNFWREVGRIIPGYESARDALRTYHPGDIPML